MDTEGWVALAERDMNAARALLDSGNLLPVGFHCQQAVEKLLKAIYALRKGEPPPRIHDLARLAAALGEEVDGRWAAEAEFLAELTDLCTRTRYGHPDWKATIAYLERDEVARRLVERTTEVCEWLRLKIR